MVSLTIYKRGDEFILPSKSRFIGIGKSILLLILLDDVTPYEIIGKPDALSKVNSFLPELTCYNFL